MWKWGAFMKIRATKSFAGIISMHKGQELDCGNKAVVQDLLRCGYVEKVKPEKSAASDIDNSVENSGDEDESERDSD